MAGFISHFSIIPDLRIERSKKYPLIEILFLSMAAVAGDAGGWEEIEDFGRDHLEWLRQFLPYENGIAGHDAIARVMSRLDPKVLEASFIGWMKEAVNLTAGQVVAIDGKLELLSIKGCIITIDAMGCQRAIREKRRLKG